MRLNIDTNKVHCNFYKCKPQLARLPQTHGEDHPGVVRIYHDNAGLLEGQNWLGDAVQMLDKSIEICERIWRRKDFDIDTWYATVRSKAGVQRKQGDIEAAAGLLNKLLVTQLEMVGTMHHTTADTYESLGAINVEQGNLEDEMIAHAKALEIRRKVLGNDHPRTQRLEACLEPLKRQKEARALNQRALAKVIWKRRCSSS